MIGNIPAVYKSSILCIHALLAIPGIVIIKSHAANLDPVELYEARQAIRPGQEAAANEKLAQAYGNKYSPLRWMDAKQAQARLTNDSAEEYTARQMAKQKCKSMLKPTRRREQEHAL